MLYRLWLRFISLFSKKPPQIQGAEIKRGMVLGIVIGPNRKSPVFSPPYQATTAFQYCAEIAEMMKDYIVKQELNVKPVIVVKEPQGVAAAYHILEQAKCDAVIELQMNAFNKEIQGTETLCSSNDRDLYFAGLIHRGLVNLWSRKGKFDRGVKALSRGDRGSASAHAFDGGVNCIVEPGFCDNAADAHLAIQDREKLAQCLVNGAVLWGRKQSLL